MFYSTVKYGCYHGSRSVFWVPAVTFTSPVTMQTTSCQYKLSKKSAADKF